MLKFQGLRNVGERATKANTGVGGDTVGAIMSWLANVQANSTEPNYDGAASVQQIGLIGGGSGIEPVSGWSFLIDPTANQGSFTFGKPRSMQLTVQFPPSFATVDGASFYIPGRVFVNIIGSGQLYAFTPKRAPLDSAYIFSGGPLYEIQNLVVPVRSGVPGTIQIVQEIDANQNGAANPDYTAVRLSLFNYEVSPVAA
jgi:hypothetical protein